MSNKNWARFTSLKNATRALALLAFISLTLASFAFQASTAQNVVPNAKLGDKSSTVNFNNAKPANCSSLALTQVEYVSSLTYGGSNPNELILGNASNQSLNGKNGDDCIIGGAGIDTLNGGNGNDVCIGGPGVDIFNSNCEVQIQDNPTY